MVYSYQSYFNCGYVLMAFLTILSIALLMLSCFYSYCYDENLFTAISVVTSLNLNPEP